MLPKPQPHVVIFGGTHGNELTGVHLVRHWQKEPTVTHRPSFETRLVIANPQAIAVGRRYVDHDLNRCFLPKDLKGNTPGYEFARARALAQEVGATHPVQEQVLIDLHTTTSNMGPTIILTTINSFNLELARRLQQILPALRIITNALDREESPFVNGMSPYGFCVEVGPVAQGTLDPKVVSLTQTLVLKTLDVLEDYFRAGEWSAWPSDGDSSVEIFEYDETVDYPRNADESLAAMIHPERYGYDFVPVEKGSPLFLGFDGEAILNQRQGIFWPIFLGESAYLEKQTAMVLTRKRRLALS